MDETSIEGATERDENISDVTYNIHLLRESARRLAAGQKSNIGPKYITPLKPRLLEAREVLVEAYRVLTRRVKAEKEITPASEWLIDNFYIIQEQVVQVENDFPQNFQRNIPSLTSGEYRGWPRVYEMVLNLAIQTDNLIDLETLLHYVGSYQEEKTLMLGEVWAIPIMARLVLLLQLSDKASGIIQMKRMQAEVESFVHEIESKQEVYREPGIISHRLSKWMSERSAPGDQQRALTELFYRMQAGGLLGEEERRWFRGRFQRFESNVEEALRIKAQRESRIQISIQNAVISLRTISETDWKEFVESCSQVDQLLKLDPAAIYPEMDFRTRDRYRQTVERLSRRSNLTETEVVENLFLLAEEQPEPESPEADPMLDRSSLRQHVGYWLLGDGYEELTKKIGYRMPLRERMQRMLQDHAGWYLGMIGAVTTVLLLILWYMTGAASYPVVVTVSLLLAAFFPALDLSVSAINRLFAIFLPPRILPKMEFKEKIPEESRTLVVVPTLLTSTEDVRNQVESLEIRALANQQPSLQFVLLSDFTDAPEKETAADREILEEAKKAIAELNGKYDSTYGEKFFLLHRERQWNESEGVWMGWERKRGKLEELNLLLIDPNAKTSYTFMAGNFMRSVHAVPVRFVITLDADTKLPPESAADLVRAASHPLNRAWYDPVKRRIDKGYAIIQPRISIPPESARKTWFSRIFSGNVGIDPYSTAVSDIYQDLTGEAVFTGKGIYDVRAFQHVLHERFRDNRILSHDLLESTYLRAGLASEIELYDDYPSTYSSYSKRNHRWTRGDWQVASWILPKVPEKSGKVKNPINPLSRWKIFDNLRRSLNPFFLTLFLILGWFWLPGSGWIWTAAAFGILAFPIYVSLSTDLLNRPARVKWKLYLDKVRANLVINSVQAVSTLIFLPHQAVLQLDAICRTLWRLIVSRRSLLEWTTASHAEYSTPNSLLSYSWLMGFSVLLGVALLIAAPFAAPDTIMLVALFGLLWLSAPVYAWKISQPVPVEEMVFSKEERLKLRDYARKTWFYFERFMTEEHSWLPPDNYQEDPPLKPVSRTSPTNIGLALVSFHSAYNFGYITFGEFVEQAGRTLRSLEQLERYRGHFYNWYDTRHGSVLNPMYISTVDSGNLAAGLIVIKEALRQKIHENGVNRSLPDGLNDTIRSIEEVIRTFLAKNVVPVEDAREISKRVEAMQERLAESRPVTAEQMVHLLTRLRDDAKFLAEADLGFLEETLSEQRFEDLRFLLGSPLSLIDRARRECTILSNLYDGDLSDISVAGILQKAEEEGKSREEIYRVQRWIRKAGDLISICERLIDEMDFTFLYDRKRHLFTIGYDVSTSQTDKSTYDLLASEARIASYIAIAKGDVPSEHWFRLSRRLTSLKRNEILLSWGGTVFEYLMPLLFMRSYPNTLLSHTYDSVIRWQIDYGSSRSRPWGASESAYYFLNLEMHYQYKAFGVPGLGMKRGLAEEYVVAPYATMLSLMVKVPDSLENLQRLEEIGGSGVFGFYDAIDFTPTRLKERETHKVVRSYMAHHHGMSLIALDNILNGWKSHHLFHSDPRVKGCDLLLQERIPRGVPVKEPHPIDVELEAGEQQVPKTAVGHAGIGELDHSPPRLHLLSNGDFTTMITHAGTGYSRYLDTALTAWRPDPVLDGDGLLFYVRDLTTGEYWSAGHQPVRRRPDRYDTWFHPDKVVTSRVDNWVETTMETTVSPDHPVELRKLTLTNYSNRERKLELTSYAEVVLQPLHHHNAHPAFSRLFLQTDYLHQQNAILVRRRPREEEERPVWLVHTVMTPDREASDEGIQFETDKGKFIGRGRTLAAPAAMDRNVRLSGSLGNVPDPVVSLRCSVTLMPGEKKDILFATGWADSRQAAVNLADIYQNQHAAERAFELASVYSRVELAHLNIDSAQALLFQRLASPLFYPDPAYRGSPESLVRNRKTQQGLWPYGISGDQPLVVFRVTDTEHLRAVRAVLRAYKFWKQKGLKFELVILNDHPPSYADELQEALLASIEQASGVLEEGQPTDLFLLRTDRVSREDLSLIESVALLYIDKKLPDLLRSGEPGFCRSWHSEDDRTAYSPVRPAPSPVSEKVAGKEPLKFFNGYGGFAMEGREYRIRVQRSPETGRHRFPPAPWSNVVANPGFGFLVTERGAGYTWSENSRENKLTGWSNEPVTDPHTEAFYLRDDRERLFWSPTPGPAAGDGDYEISHGFGYSRFGHRSMELDQELTQFVCVADSVKISTLKIVNRSSGERELSLFWYQERVLGVERNHSVRHVVTTADTNEHRLYSQNHYNNEFAGRIAFMAPGGVIPEHDTVRFTADRARFIGRNRTLQDPAGLCMQEQLDNRIVTGGDACGVLQVKLKLDAGEERTLVFLSGEASSRSEADRLIERYQSADAAAEELENVKVRWEKLLGRVQVDIPDESLQLMMNGWLNYQSISSRMWARTAYYQAGGAFGFRDQLQDAMACLYADPAMARNQILLHARHQFRQGDVLHWWHPPTGRGIRSRITDDRLWLPYVTDFYLQSTGDESLLKEMVPWIHTRDLEPGEQEAYLVPQRVEEYDTLYEHCCRAIEISLSMGRHGLPLIGAGDWNDGMNAIGSEGEGESVWLGFFLCQILERFAEVCRRMDDPERAERYLKEAEQLRENLNRHGWDGEWYLRAYYDDGTPVGSSRNEECRIDAISQSWSIITGVAPEERRSQVLDSLESHLIRPDERIIRLLTPPFDRTDKNPGYIKGYIPGVRENGGQYTHAALWTVKAFAESNYGDKAAGYLSMINPVNHSKTAEGVGIYQVEPYVVAADVYGEPPLTGRGGWTWYTGSAGWMYRVALESILGLTFRGEELRIRPVIASGWETCGIRVILPDDKTCYEIEVKNPSGAQCGPLRGVFDGEPLQESEDGALRIPLVSDGSLHKVLIEMSAPD